MPAPVVRMRNESRTAKQIEALKSRQQPKSKDSPATGMKRPASKAPEPPPSKAPASLKRPAAATDEQSPGSPALAPWRSQGQCQTLQPGPHQ